MQLPQGHRSYLSYSLDSTNHHHIGHHSEKEILKSTFSQI
jgi:hypothetical protein